MTDKAVVGHPYVAGALLPSSPSEVHVLVVDDERLSRMIVANLLRRCNYRVTMAESASEAIRVLDEKASQFDLVLTDVMMPDVGGIGLLRHVQEKAALRGIPVIMMSANEHKDTVFECISRGAEDYLLKPVTRKEVQHIWMHVWRRKQKSLSVIRGDAAETMPEEGGDAQKRSDEGINAAVSDSCCKRSMADVDVPNVQHDVGQSEDICTQDETRKNQDTLGTRSSWKLEAKRRRVEFCADNGCHIDEDGTTVKPDAQMRKESNGCSIKEEPESLISEARPTTVYSRSSVEYKKFIFAQWVNSGRPDSISKYIELSDREKRSSINRVNPTLAQITAGAKSRVCECGIQRLSGLDLHILVVVCDILSEDILSNCSLGVLNHSQFIFSIAGGLKLSEKANNARNNSVHGSTNNIKTCEQEFAYIANLLADLCGLHRAQPVAPSTDAGPGCHQSGGSPWLTVSQKPCGTHEHLKAFALRLMGINGGFPGFDSIQIDPAYMQLKEELNQKIYKFSREQEWRQVETMKEFFSLYCDKRKQKISQNRELLSAIDRDISNLKDILTEKGHTELISIDESEASQLSHSHFVELKGAYFKHRGPRATARQDLTDTLTRPISFPLNSLAEQIRRLKNPPAFNCLGRIQQCTALHSSNMVSNIAFSKETDIFCTVGISRRIRLYRYSRLVAAAATTDPSSTGSSEEELDSRSKLSAVAWSPFIVPMLGTSSFEGSVVLWDTNTGNMVQELEEHTQRVRSLEFCTQDPRIVLSGGEDNMVKMWALNSSGSTATVNINSPVCSVQFRPNSAVQFAAACVDDTVQMFDLRKLSAPILRLNGHLQTVSSSKWVDSNHLVSSSTDGTLKLWSISRDDRSGTCLRSYSGHLNKKNFVGLDINPRGDLICGSEDNCIYLYMQTLSRPVSIKPFNEVRTTTTSSQVPLSIATPPRDGHFISAVCVKPNSNAVVVASSNSGLAIFNVE